MNDSLSHNISVSTVNKETISSLVEQINDRLEANKENLHLPLSETKCLLTELSEFELGRFLLKNQGLNGYWTAYIFRNEKQRNQLAPLEDWLLNESLFVMARERFYVFKQLAQKALSSNMTLASIPCGLMDDLLDLDYSSVDGINLVGVDIDKESLELASQNALAKGFSSDQLFFAQRDAWSLGLHNELDLIVSNGLNMYESSEERLISLYQQMYQALTEGGRLIISFIPPLDDNVDIGMSHHDFLTERAIFDDIIQVNYLNFCTEEQMRKQLQDAGFEVECIIYNSKGMAPVVEARK